MPPEPDRTESPEPDEITLPMSSAEAAVIDAARLFGDAREVQIELDGIRYRLRITRRGKLILQK